MQSLCRGCISIFSTPACLLFVLRLQGEGQCRSLTLLFCNNRIKVNRDTCMPNTYLILDKVTIHLCRLTPIHKNCRGIHSLCKHFVWLTRNWKIVNGAFKNAIAQRLSTEIQLNNLSINYIIHQCNLGNADIVKFSTEVQAACWYGFSHMNKKDWCDWQVWLSGIQICLDHCKTFIFLFLFVAFLAVFFFFFFVFRVLITLII